MFAALSKWLLNLFGWRLVGQPPKIKKYVLIVAPHTSNWDFFIFILLKFHFRMKVSFIGKHSIFIGPVGWVLKRLGGIPVDRRKAQNVVQVIVDLFNESEEMAFALSPEGTRSYKDHWKTGFYNIASNAKVPIQFCYLDATTKTLGFGPLFEISGDLDKDFEVIREFYSDKKGLRPELFSEITYKKKIR